MKQFCINKHDTFILGRRDRRCVQCIRDYMKSWRASTRGIAFKQNYFQSVTGRERTRNYDLARHGLTPETYQRLFDAQNGSCFVCKDSAGLLCIDHDHSCCPTRYSCGNCIRGLLCSRCNRILGFAVDDTTLLRNLANYVETTAPKKLL